MLNNMPVFVLCQCLAMVVITIVNIAVGQIRIVINLERECRRLRLALRAELTEMLRVNTKNLRNLRTSRPYILSSRACTAVYKANLPRIITIVDKEIALLVRVHAVNEQLEHLVAATTKGAGPMAFKVVEGETPIDEIVDEIQRSSEQIEEALEALRCEDRRPSPGFSFSALFRNRPRPLSLEPATGAAAE